MAVVDYMVIVRRFTWGILALLFAVGVTFVFLPQCNRLRELQRTRLQLIEDNRRLSQLTRELVDRLEQFDTNPGFVERTAREEGMVKPGEVVFRLSEAGTDDTRPQPPARGAP